MAGRFRIVFGRTKRKEQSPQFHPQPFNAWSNILVRDLVGSHYFGSSCFWSQPESIYSGQEVPPHDRTPEAYGGEGTGETMGPDWQLPGRTLKISHKKCYQCLSLCNHLESLLFIHQTL